MTKQNKLASYVMTTDSGFAPNPFYGYCTLAACTPNHRPYRIESGNWIVGTSTAGTGNKLIYAMHVSEVIDHDDYFRDKRFARKKPTMNGSWRNRCGDNIYHRNRKGDWVSEACVHHIEAGALTKDTQYSRVFIAREFYYFGDEMIEIPAELQYIIHGTQGLKYVRDESRIESFVEWLKTNYSEGLNGNPTHKESGKSCQPKATIPDCSRPKKRC